MGKIFPSGNLRHEPAVHNGNHMCDEIRNIYVATDNQYHLETEIGNQRAKKVAQLGACGCIEAYKGIVHDEHPGSTPQGFGQLELAQFATTQRDDILVIEFVQMEDSD